MNRSQSDRAYLAHLELIARSAGNPAAWLGW